MKSISLAEALGTMFGRMGVHAEAAGAFELYQRVRHTGRGAADPEAYRRFHSNGRVVKVTRTRVVVEWDPGWPAPGGRLKRKSHKPEGLEVLPAGAGGRLESGVDVSLLSGDL